jgi:hypothetical protein
LKAEVEVPHAVGSEHRRKIDSFPNVNAVGWLNARVGAD